MKYDLNHIVKSLHQASQSTKIEVKPTIDEKSIAINFGGFIEMRKRKRYKVAVYEFLCFLESLKFMLCSLDKQVQNLPNTKCSLLDDIYRDHTDKHQKLVKKKGSFLYSDRKLSDVSLPSLKQCKNILKDNQIDVTNEELRQLDNGFKVLNRESAKHFLELYLTRDALRLACWFDGLRSA